MSKILQREVDVTALSTAPEAVRQLLRRCLEKDPTLRLRDIGEARIALQNSQSIAFLAPQPTEAAKPLRRNRLVAVLAVLTLVAVAFAGGSRLRQQNPPRSRLRFSIALPSGHALMSGPVISRDGHRIAYVSSDGSSPQMLYVKELFDFEGRLIPGTEGAAQPFFSPDGRWVAFFAKGRLIKHDIDGGAAKELANAPSPMGGTWREDGTIVFTPTWNGGLYRIRADGDQPELLIRPASKAEYAYTWPHFLPGGRDLLFTIWGTTFSVSRLTLPTLEQHVVAPEIGTGAVYAASGHVLFGTYAGQLQALSAREAVSGGLASPFNIVDKIYWTGRPSTGESSFDISLDGTLVYAPGDITRRSLVVVNENGQAIPVEGPHHAYSWISLAPDGRRAAVVYDANIWIQDLERGLSTLLVSEMTGAHNGFPIWTPDGSRIVFASNYEGNWDLYSKTVSSAGTLDVVVKKEFDQFPLSIAPDGTLVFSETRPGTGYDIWTLPLKGEPQPWLATAAEEAEGRVSPDGQFVSYSSDESGRREIYVRALRGSQERLQVSSNGGTEPVWSPDGKRLFYRRGTRLMAADVTGAGHLVVSRSRELFHTGWERGTGRHQGNRSSFAVLPDGRRFLMLHYEAEAIPTRINVILDGFDELKRRAPTN